MTLASASSHSVGLVRAGWVRRLMPSAAPAQTAMLAAIGTGVGVACAFWRALTTRPPTALTPNWRKPRTADAFPAIRPWGDMASTVVLGKTNPIDAMTNQRGT